MTRPHPGTVAVTNGSVTVIGSNTSWDSVAHAGWGFVDRDNRVYEIASVKSDTELMLTNHYLGSSGSGQSYKLFPPHEVLLMLLSHRSPPSPLT